jgi:serine/threonine-protein kinase
MGQILVERFEVVRRIGEGGMAVVYLGRELEAGTERALKVLAPQLADDAKAVERLRREAELAMQLDHPNVCPILHVGETSEGFLFLVMPFLEGESLAQALDARGTFDCAEGLPLLVDIARGLAHAHRVHILHRDLKPENVMLVPASDRPHGRRAVVMDFGLAKHMDAGAEVQKLTATGIVLGTPEFMSPEQVRGQPLDERSDLYAVGVLAFELFTGELPFEGRTPQDQMIARLKSAPRKMRSIVLDFPPALEAVILRTLASEPDRRYPTVDAFVEALSHADPSVRPTP